MQLITELCNSGDLHVFLRKHGPRGLPSQMVLTLMVQLVSGLKFLWQRNLIHRDIKPHNLLLHVLPGGSHVTLLKIADFGFARELSSAAMAETVCGSPLYMAPEILKLRRYNSKADLWSVGAVLFELVSGVPPYEGKNQIQLLHNIEHAELRFPPGIGADISSNCVALIRQLLQRNPLLRISFDDFFVHPFLRTDAAAAARSAVDASVERAAADRTKHPSPFSTTASPLLSAPNSEFAAASQLSLPAAATARPAASGLSRALRAPSGLSSALRDASSGGGASGGAAGRRPIALPSRPVATSQRPRSKSVSDRLTAAAASYARSATPQLDASVRIFRKERTLSLGQEPKRVRANSPGHGFVASSGCDATAAALAVTSAGGGQASGRSSAATSPAGGVQIVGSANSRRSSEGRSPSPVFVPAGSSAGSRPGTTPPTNFGRSERRRRSGSPTQGLILDGSPPGLSNVALFGTSPSEMRTGLGIAMLSSSLGHGSALNSLLPLPPPLPSPTIRSLESPGETLTETVSIVLLCTVTFHANLAHSLTCSP